MPNIILPLITRLLIIQILLVIIQSHLVNLQWKKNHRVKIVVYVILLAADTWLQLLLKSQQINPWLNCLPRLPVIFNRLLPPR